MIGLRNECASAKCDIVEDIALATCDNATGRGSCKNVKETIPDLRII